MGGVVEGAELSLCLLRCAGTSKVVKVDVKPVVDLRVNGEVLLTDLLQTTPHVSTGQR